MSAAVTHIDINIFYLILHKKVMMLIAWWVKAVEVVCY